MAERTEPQPQRDFCCRSAADGGMINNRLNVLLQQAGAAVGGAGDPGRIRTCDHKLRRLVLYPAELRGRRAGDHRVIASGDAFGNRRLRGRGGLAAHPVVAEIVGVALRLLGFLVRRDDGVVETVLVGVGHGFVECGEA